MKKISLIGILALIFLWVRTMEIFLTNSPWFELKVLNISGNEDLSKDEVLKLSGVRLKRNIFRINLKDIEKRVEKDQRVKSVEVKRVIPQEIQVRVQEKKPDLLVNLKPSSKLYGLSVDGEIIPLKDSFSYDLPLISGIKSRGVKPYSRIEDADIQTALTFYKIVEKEKPSFLEKISEMNLEDKDNLVVIIVKTGTKIFFGAGDFQKKFERFIWLNKDLVFDGYKGIDLRFKDQVIFKRVNPVR
ncbi:MAG: FtsQ-type POTRA domain-containing protein [candidate division Zixibacteria bacterium]|nr:FtsQ-type POTRA domain-containing protein [candidate division Zixibacteria bacterium]